MPRYPVLWLRSLAFWVVFPPSVVITALLLLPIEQGDGALQRRDLLAFDLVELDANALDPVRIRARPGEGVLQRLVIDDPALLEIV